MRISLMVAAMVAVAVVGTGCGEGVDGSLPGDVGEANGASGPGAVDPAASDSADQGLAVSGAPTPNAVPSSCIGTHLWWDTHYKTVNATVTNKNCKDAQGRNLILKARVIWKYWKDGSCRNIYPGASSTWSAPAPPAVFDRVEQCN